MNETAGPRDAIAFAEKILELLHEGRYTTTYKYAVLLALMDLCLEHTERSGAPPSTVRTRDLAEKIVELYWPHTVAYGEGDEPQVLRQIARGQAEILSAIQRFRAEHAPDPSTPRWAARIAAQEQFEGLIRFVEWKLIEMPLPRLQVMGIAPDEFIYKIGWTQAVRRQDVDRYQRGEPGGFDNRITLRPNVGEYLIQLNGLLRPLIHRTWAAMVARLNGLEESRLEAFLFGVDRTGTARIRGGLWELQGKRCFYCDARVLDPSRAHVDHFIPWARYPDDGIENLVVADARCNEDKSSSLAASEHVVRWATRFRPSASLGEQLVRLAEQAGWDRRPQRTLNVARAIYLRLPADAKLWLRGKNFAALDRPAIEGALSAA